MPATLLKAGTPLRMGRHAVLLAASAVLAFHALLLPLGAWHADEYMLFAFIHRLGWSAVSDRLVGWSPRPFSEVALYAYARLVEWQGAPHVGWMLAAIWGVTLAVLIAAGRISGLGVTPALAVPAAALLVATPGEMWYWPAASAAYLPALAGIASAALLLCGGAPGRGAAAFLSASLTLAAGSAEAAAILVLVLGAAQLARHALSPVVRRVAPEEPAWVWLPPLLLAAGVLLVLATARGAQMVEAVSPGPTVGNLWLSLEAAQAMLGPILLGVPATPREDAPIWFGLAVKLAILAGYWGLLPGGPRPLARRLTCVLGLAAILVTILASAAFAFRQFGVLCCPRHETFRQGLLVVTALFLAATLPAGPGVLRRAAPWVMAAALIVMLVLRWPALRADLALAAPIAEIRAANWAAGRAAGEAMSFRNEPLGRLTSRSWFLPPGIHRRPDHGLNKPREMDMHAFAVLLYFGKLEMHAR